VQSVRRYSIPVCTYRGTLQLFMMDQSDSNSNSVNSLENLKRSGMVKDHDIPQRKREASLPADPNSKKQRQQQQIEDDMKPNVLETKQLLNTKVKEKDQLSEIDCTSSLGFKSGLALPLDLERAVDHQISCKDKEDVEILYWNDNENENSINIDFRKGTLSDVTDIARFCLHVWPQFIDNDKPCHEETSSHLRTKGGTHVVPNHSCTENEDIRNCNEAEDKLERIEQILRNGLGDEVTPSVCIIFICDVKGEKTCDDIDRTNQSVIGGVALMNIIWDEKRILQVELLHIDKKWEGYGLHKRFLIRLSGLTLASGCEELKIINF